MKQPFIRKQAYYRINRLAKLAYHARIRAGEPAGIYEVYKEMNDRLVTVFAHGGLIDAATAAALEADMAAHGPYFGVVANAGVSADAPFPILEGDAWDKVIDTDLTGLYNLLKPVVMPMISNRIRGRIVALSSVSGVAGNRGQVNYSAAKAGVIGATKALAVELAKRGITVNAVAPGVIETEMAATIEEPELVKRAIPMRRFGTPEELLAMKGKYYKLIQIQSMSDQARKIKEEENLEISI